MDSEPAENQEGQSGTVEPGPENQPAAPAIRRGPGGRRPGAGRPKGSRDKLPKVRPNRRASFREMYDQAVEQSAPRIIRAAIRQATRGDSRALIDVLNRVLGPPSQKVELSGPGGAPLALQAAAPVALALMSTEELRALLGLQARLGLPDVQLAPVRDLLSERTPDGAPGLLADAPDPSAEPGQDEPLQSPPLPLPGPLLREHLDPTAPAPKLDPPGQPDIHEPMTNRPTSGPAQPGEPGEDGRVRASHLPVEQPADGAEPEPARRSESSQDRGESGEPCDP